MKMSRSCKNCFYQEHEISEYPCSNCKHAYADLWKSKVKQTKTKKINTN
jgi:hypothetical protein